MSPRTGAARPRILILAPQLPWPPHQGTAIRNLHIALHLAERHDVTLAAFAPDGADPGPLPAAGIALATAPPPPPRPLAVRLRDLPTTAVPDLARRLDSPAFSARLARLIAESPPFDVVQIEGLEMARHGLAVHALAAARGHRPRLIYDAHNAEWVLQDRAWRTDIRRPRTWVGAAYSIVQTAKIRRFERALVRAAYATAAVSAADADALRALAPGARIVVVPNGVDLDHYAPADPNAVTATRCAFTGKMDFRPNIDAAVWLCERVWPRVRAACPDATLALVGRDPAPRVTALANNALGIDVTGAVPDTRPFIADAGVIVVPLRVGGGTRLKVLEAMAMAKPIVATTLAVEGLDLEDGVEACLADDPAAFAAAVVELMGDPAARADLGAAARRRAERDFGWSALVPRLAALYDA